jgi:hypothetical protein
MESLSKDSPVEQSCHADISGSAFFNNITYTPPKVPTLYSVISTGEDAVNSLVYGEFSHSFVLDHLQTIEIVVNNHGESQCHNTLNVVLIT